MRSFLLCALVGLGGCSKVTCGEGSVLDDTICVPTYELACGEGTSQAGGECVADVVLCGPGTVLVDGSCEADPLTCGSGTVRRGDACVSVREQWVYLPLPEGTDGDVSQGHHGGFSHNGGANHAVDLRMPEGSPIAAARGGIVLQAREDSDTGCGDVSCANQANYLVIDHGDGTLGRYWHLEQDGVLVEVGDEVERGQIVARSGNTGWSTGPHLHFEVDDLFRQSLPVRFHDLEETGGVAFAGAPLRSQNNQVQNAETPDWSTCPTDLYGFMGVTLDDGLPCTAVSGPTLRLTGQAHGVADEAVGAANPDSDGWDYSCHSTASDGTFDVTVDFVGTRGGYLMIGQGDGDCTFGQSWAHSPWVIRAP